MSWANVAGAGIGLVGGLLSSNSAKGAANTQSQAATQASNNQLQSTREANQLTADMYKNGLLQQAPYQRGGQLSLSALMSGLGLGGARAADGMQPGQSTGVNTPVGSFVDAQGRAVDAQGNPIRTSGTDYGITGLNYGATQNELDSAAGSVAPGYFNKTFTAEDLKAGIDPGYQFRLDQGNMAINARRAATGNRFGGQALKDIVNYNQDAGSQEFANAYARNLQQKSLLYDRLAGLAGVGQSAGNSAAAAGTAAGNTIGQNTLGGAKASSDYLTSGAAASAGGQVGSTNAIVGGINQGMNNWYTNQILNRYTQPSSNAGMPMINGGGFSNTPAYLLDPGP